MHPTFNGESTPADIFVTGVFAIFGWGWIEGLREDNGKIVMEGPKGHRKAFRVRKFGRVDLITETETA